MAVRSASASKPKVSAQKEKTSKKENMKKVESRAQSDDNGPRKLLPNSLAKRTKCPGIRVKGGRIYDSENGKTCHQCRQKTRDFVASCKVMKGKKQCTISFCHKCLLNRYGEKAEEMAMLDDWKCPKCRGICNCSNCMKKRGHKPTGILVHAAKATGFSSVSEMLHMKGPENSCHDKIVKVAGVSPKRTVAPNKENPSVLQRKRGKENSFDENIGSDLQHRNSTFNPDEKKPKKMKQEGIEKMHDGNRDSDAPLKNSNTKKPQVSKETSKEIVKKNGKEGSVMLDKKQSRMRVSRDVSSSSIKKEGKNGGRDGVTHKVVEVSDCSKIDNAGAKPSVILDKKQSKVQVSREVYSSPIKKEEKNGGRDEPTHKVIEVLDCSTTDSEGSKPKTVESHKVENCTVTLQNKNFDADIPMPQGTELTTIAGVELLPEDVGQALQFLEFCATFGKVLNVKKVQAESVLHELTRGPLTLGRSARRGQNSLIVWFHTQLLSLILKDMGEDVLFRSLSLSQTNGKNSWLQALGKCVSKSQDVFKEMVSDCFDKGGDGYDELDFSKKLRLLNFLCDETLSTVKLRSWIDDQNSKFVETGKEAKEKVNAAKDKEKRVKQKLQDEVAKAIIAKNGAPLSISEHEAIVSQIKTEAAKAHAEMLEAMGMVPKKRQRSDAVRTEPILLDVNGHAYWRLKGYSDEDILLQEMGAWDTVALHEKWCYYDAEQENSIEKYISSRREKRLRFQSY